MQEEVAITKLKDFLKANHIQLRVSEQKVKRVDDGSLIIEPPIIIVTPEPKEEKVN